MPDIATTDTAQKLYLDLLKQTLTYYLWGETLVPVNLTPRAIAASPQQKLKRAAIQTADKLIKSASGGTLNLAYQATFDAAQRLEGRDWPPIADTMIGLNRLDNIQVCIETILREGVAGDLIETGVWRGGATIFMRGVLKAYQITDRAVWVADSFEGLPQPDAEKYPLDKADTHYLWNNILGISQETVQKNFQRYGLLDDQVKFLKGWFKDTLPTAPIAQLALMRLDGDMYESTIDALTHLYPKLSDGGYVIIDDYFLKGCSQAVHDYRNQHGITAPLQTIDWAAVYWRKW
jgi:hypothetical protein